mmetsp:Transcript_46476/g.56298  ORF Transcript_46476/g.56298 Transcript_46476/m.56298 type:complete len:240 (+) Transcript_46476:34-753(+)
MSRKPQSRSKAWDKNYEQLVAFKTAHGHCRVPQVYNTNRSLGKWVAHQRHHYNLLKQEMQSPMTSEKIEYLENIGFDWRVSKSGGDKDFDEAWLKRFEELKSFMKKNGHCRVPQVYASNPALGTWVSNQRYLYKCASRGKSTSMTAARIQVLEKIGFEWRVSMTGGDNNFDERWWRRYEELIQYKKINGNLRVPRIYDQNTSLGQWVCRQRYLYDCLKEGKPSSMSLERAQALEVIGFE